MYKNFEDLCTSLKKTKNYLKTKINQMQPTRRRSVKEKKTNSRGSTKKWTYLEATKGEGG